MNFCHDHYICNREYIEPNSSIHDNQREDDILHQEIKQKQERYWDLWN